MIKSIIINLISLNKKRNDQLKFFFDKYYLIK